MPRPETGANLVEFILENPASKIQNLKLLDVGTGSGVIALTLAAKLDTAAIDAVDVSEEALALARENAARLGLATRVNFLQSDLFENAAGPYGLIAANLPNNATDAQHFACARCNATRSWRSTGAPRAMRSSRG